MRSILTCSTHTSGLYFQDLSFLKSWKCSRERGQQCWVLKLGLMRGESVASVSLSSSLWLPRSTSWSLSAPAARVLPPSLPLSAPALMLVDVTGFHWDGRRLQNSSGNTVCMLLFLRKSCRDRQRRGLLSPGESGICLALVCSLIEHSCSFGRGDEIQMLVLVFILDSKISMWLNTLERLAVCSNAALSFTWESQKSLVSFSFQFSFRGFLKTYFPSLLLFLRTWGCFQMVS